ncbi:MAG TPA: carbohydrate kinase, partial [Chryseolinea sp.]|nr:carbohydrate kinase [Chryseolinea sp.]
TDGAKGAALGAGIGCGVYSSFEEAFSGLKMIQSEDPDKNKTEQYSNAFASWLQHVEKQL